MYHSIQVDILAQTNPVHHFIRYKLLEIFSMNDKDLIVICQLLPPGIMPGDSNIPIFCFYNIEENIISDSERAISFASYLKERFKYRLSLKVDYMSEIGVRMDQYFICINYIIVSKNYFTSYISGHLPNVVTDPESSILLENAYADIMLNQNIKKMLKVNPNFKLNTFESNKMTKVQILEFYINNMDFSRYMKSRITGSIGEMNLIELYI